MTPDDLTAALATVRNAIAEWKRPDCRAMDAVCDAVDELTRGLAVLDGQLRAGDTIGRLGPRDGVIEIALSDASGVGTDFAPTLAELVRMLGMESAK